jgi:predicted MFS family arabinose efflux permease
MTQGPARGWGSPVVVGPTLAGAVLVAAFIAWELRQAEPLVQLRVFKDRGFTAAIITMGSVAMALFGAVFLVPVFMQQVQGYSTVDTGLLLGAQGITAAALMPISGTLTDRIGPRPVVLAGIAMLAGSTAWMTTVSTSTSTVSWIGMLALRGAGMGFAMMPAFAAAYVTIAPQMISRATALANTLQRVFSSFGIAMLATIIAWRVTVHLPARPTPLGARAAAAQSFDETLWVAFALVLLSVPAAFFLQRARRPD